MDLMKLFTMMFVMKIMRKMVTLFLSTILFLLRKILIGHSYLQQILKHKDIDLDQLPKFDEYLDIVGREEVIVHPSFDLVEEREIVVDTIPYCSLNFPKEDKKSCDIFQQLVDYEKKSLFHNYVKV